MRESKQDVVCEGERMSLFCYVAPYPTGMMEPFQIWATDWSGHWNIK